MSTTCFPPGLHGLPDATLITLYLKSSTLLPVLLPLHMLVSPLQMPHLLLQYPSKLLFILQNPAPISQPL